jgi:hypothetical protein
LPSTICRRSGTLLPSEMRSILDGNKKAAVGS